jgi:hypothetical protein
MNRLAISTSDFRFYYEIVKLLKEWSLPFVNLAEDQEMPEDVVAVLSSTSDEEVLPQQIRGDTAIGSLRKSLPRFIDRVQFDRLIIGVDPGPKPGVAIVADGILIEAREASTIDSLTQFVKDALNDYPFELVSVRVGNGDKPNRDRIINNLRGLDLSVIIVDEANTTIPHKRENNALSAAIIAMAKSNPSPGNVPGKKALNNIERNFLTIRNVIYS